MVSEMKLGHPVVLGWRPGNKYAHQSVVSKIMYSNDYSIFSIELMNPSQYSHKNKDWSMQLGIDHIRNLNDVFHIFSVWK